MDASGNWLILVTNGSLKLGDYPGDPGTQALANLEAGSFVSSLNLRAGESVSAGEQKPVELLVVEGPEFQQWLGQNPANRTALEEAAMARGAPHRSLVWNV